MVQSIVVKRSTNTTDGFVPRRPHRADIKSQYENETENTISTNNFSKKSTSQMHTGNGDVKLHLNVDAQSKQSGLKNSISDSLSMIDETAVGSPRQRRKQRGKKKKRIKLISLIIGLLLLIGLGWLVFRAWTTFGNVFQNGNMLGVFQYQPLKKDAYGRSNVLIVGSTDDDPNRPGASLTDSIMVLSVDQDKKDAYIFSIPRDLYVKFGMPCNSGYEGKINEFFACSAEGDDEAAEAKRMEETRKFVGGIFGMDIQYIAHINTMVIRDSVNAVGGVTVDVQSSDPRGVLDASLDWMCTQGNPSEAERQRRCPTGHYIDFSNGPNEMDGDKAMWFSRARGAFSGVATYGLENSNFDREKNQQLVIMALKDKAVSTGVITDVTKVVGLMDAMGNNLRTNVDPKEIQSIMKLGSELSNENIHRLGFYDENNRLMTTGVAPSNGASIVRPVAGIYDYSAIHQYLRKNIYATPVSKENAKVVVLNGSGVAGAAQVQADKLADLGMNVTFVGNAPTSDYMGTTIYRVVGEDKQTVTSEKLTELFGKNIKTGAPPFGLEAEAEFVVIVGA